MALILKDRVKETCSSPGTGTVTLLGASTGYQSFSAIGDGNTTFYTIADQGGPNWEVGIGTYTASGTTLSRDTVLASSAGGTTKANFSSGTQEVFVTYPAGKAVSLDASDNVQPNLGAVSATSITDSGNLTFTGTGNRILGDFSNATVANAVAFQTSTTNGNTIVNVLPNGTSETSAFRAYGTADPTNSSFLQIVGTTNGSRIVSGITGTGTYQPLTFSTGGSERLRITTNGGVSFGSSGTAYGTAGQVLTSNGDAAPTWQTASGTTKAQAIAYAMTLGF